MTNDGFESLENVGKFSYRARSCGRVSLMDCLAWLRNIYCSCIGNTTYVNYMIVTQDPVYNFIIVFIWGEEW